MTASVIDISIKRDQKRFNVLDELHDEYLGRWMAIMLHKSGVEASKDMGTLNDLIDEVQLEMEEIKLRGRG